MGAIHRLSTERSDENLNRVSSDPEFRADLYRGTARFYDEFRVAYPHHLLDDLRVRARITGAGRLLDLACGTGQI